MIFDAPMILADDEGATAGFACRYQPREVDVYKRQRKIRAGNSDDGEDCIAECVLHDDNKFRLPLCACSAHIILTNGFQHAGTRHAHAGCEAPGAKCKGRQNPVLPACKAGRRKPAKNNGKQAEMCIRDSAYTLRCVLRNVQQQPCPFRR